MSDAAPIAIIEFVDRDARQGPGFGPVMSVEDEFEAA